MALLSTTYSDTELVEGIGKNPEKRRIFENKLYKRYSYMIREGVWKHKLSADECSMAYSETVLIIIEHIQNGRFENRSALKTYLYQIFTNKCVDLIRKKSTHKHQFNRGETLDDYLYVLPDDSRSVIEKRIEQYDTDLLRKRLQELGDKCKQMIEACSEGFMDQEITFEIGYQSAAVVKTSRLRCLEKLREL